MRKFDAVSARMILSPKYFSTVVQKAVKPVVSMYHEATRIYFGYENVLNLVYLWVFQKYAVFDPSSHTSGVVCDDGSNKSPLGWNFVMCGHSNF